MLILQGVDSKQLLARRDSMSAGIVYHGFGIRGYEYERTIYEDVRGLASPGSVAVPTMRQRTGGAPRRGHACIPIAADRAPTGATRSGRCPGVLREMRNHATGEGRLRGRTPAPCAQFRAICVGLVSAHDHSVRGSPL